MPPRDRRGSCAPNATEGELLTLFDSMDVDQSGCLSCNELCEALKTNPDFAKLCSGSAESKVLSPIAAGLVAPNLHTMFDIEFGDSSGSVGPEEFLLLCRRLTGSHKVQQPAAGPSAAAAPAQTRGMRSISEGGGPPQPKQSKQKKGLGGLFSGQSSKPSAAVERAESRLFALQSMLREEVVERLERLLAHGSSEAPAMTEAARAELYLVLGASRRLAGSVSTPEASSRNTAAVGGSSGGGGGFLGMGGGSAAAAAANEAAAVVEAEALELQMLRRTLVETKVALAEAVSARDVAEHSLRQLTREGERRGRNSVFTW